MKVDLTYGNKLNVLINGIVKKQMDINYTVDGDTGDTTTTSILINGGTEEFLMITFDYQELKNIVEGKKI